MSTRKRGFAALAAAAMLFTGGVVTAAPASAAAPASGCRHKLGGDSTRTVVSDITCARNPTWGIRATHTFRDLRTGTNRTVAPVHWTVAGTSIANRPATNTAALPIPQALGVRINRIG